MATMATGDDARWHAVREVARELASVQAVLGDALRLSIDGRNADALPAVEVLVHEVERLLVRTLAAFAEVGAPEPAAG